MEHSHVFKTINDNADGRLEICIQCKYRLATKKDAHTGRIDNRKYLKDHVVDTAQPFGKTGKIFIKHYGDSAQYISRFKK